MVLSESTIAGCYSAGTGDRNTLSGPGLASARRINQGLRAALRATQVRHDNHASAVALASSDLILI